MADRSRADAWRAKAEELRVIAESIKHDGSRSMLFGLAEQYERLARRAEGKSLPDKDKKVS
jgi:hypothetical protein